uniref:Uncharacterized protein n=1 Tax=Anguilla anguilla TaxID=7936 RepID=A0A0E9RV71_ANGAN
MQARRTYCILSRLRLHLCVVPHMQVFSFNPAKFPSVLQHA